MAIEYGYCSKHGKVPDIYDGSCPECFNHLTFVPVDPDSQMPVCFGHDDCSAMMLARCPFAKECGEIAEKEFKNQTGED